jgi:hypothetical protein
MLGVFAVWWPWLAVWGDLEKMTAPLTSAEREALRKAEEFGVGTRINRLSKKSERRRSSARIKESAAN